eukprot:5239813-Pyramimonas_sp.AAC.1
MVGADVSRSGEEYSVGTPANISLTRKTLAAATLAGCHLPRAGGEGGGVPRPRRYDWRARTSHHGHPHRRRPVRAREQFGRHTVTIYPHTVTICPHTVTIYP